MHEHLLANAELVRKVATEQLELVVDYNEAGVRWLDEYIDTQREQANEQVKAKLPNTLGSFLGECILRTCGREWVQVPDYGWSVKVNDKVSVFPFNKVEKQLANSDGESVLGLFIAIPPLLNHAFPGGPAHHAGVEARAKRPWWKLW